MGLVKVLWIGLFVSLLSQADQVPPCVAGGRTFGVNNVQVLEWKAHTKNSFLARAHILGKLTRQYANKSGHNHFSVLIGKSQTDTVEVIYNNKFGALPRLAPGQMVEACGDYITSNRPNGHYPASPDGAILHWVHFNPKDQGHEDGYVVVDGRLAGQTAPPK